MRGDGSIDGLVRALPEPVDQHHFHPPPVGCGHANDELIPALEALARHRGSVDASCAELDSEAVELAPVAEDAAGRESASIVELGSLALEPVEVP